MSVAADVSALIERARIAQTAFATWPQARVDEAVAAAAWAILEPGRNRELAELAVRSTGLGRVEDKVRKNHRKTLGLLRDLHGVKTVGVIGDDPERGIVEIARPVGVVAAITPSTNPAVTPANKVINALKGGNAIILAPSPKGATTCSRLLEFIHAELAKVGAPQGLVLQLPGGSGKEALHELMRQADLVVATGSRANVRAAYESGTPALGVGVGNVATIVLPTAGPGAAAARIAQSKTFDNATSCSSENSLILVGDAADGMLAALAAESAVLLDPQEKAALAAAMFPDGQLAPAAIAQSAARIAQIAGLNRPIFRDARILLVEENGVGPEYAFSGEKLSPVLTVYRVPDLDAAIALVRRIYDYQGKGHSVGVHGATAAEALRLGRELPVARVIQDQIHCYAVGGSFDNGLPFSLSMGCGTWGGNSFSDNLNHRHFLNITRIVKPIPERVPSEALLLGAYWERYGR
ncbi:aldehyde dehydrogenase family protein [Azoarcus sp. KH32C]|uniref:acylating sulfoacetaldehyde dehydrogenase n=1 Tax=Azoarcus sp. KH32C TaxID=748247 RepID=UPI0002386C9C|nr:aldehyde dehydrogenase family protein [Azoarcus sp. KH32C]BAL24919.1 succinate semialdehyde dehydrogenase [NAD(P)+] [Azoarcus sp. KH32C]